VIAQAKSFEEDLICFDSETLTGDVHARDEGLESSAYSALVLGTRDYVHKCGFRQVVLGLSGGIDSALTACIAVDALGRENVVGIGMPGPYSSRGSIDDAANWRAISVFALSWFRLATSSMPTAKRSRPVFAGRQPDVTEENIQARIRGSLIMAISNKFGCLVLTTGTSRSWAWDIARCMAICAEAGRDLRCAEDAGLSAGQLRKLAFAGYSQVDH
jgi:NAD+ synthase (glutamine-hydrolysing)